MEWDRKLTEIGREISRLEGQIVEHRNAMNDEIANLQRKKQSIVDPGKWTRGLDRMPRNERGDRRGKKAV